MTMSWFGGSSSGIDGDGIHNSNNNNNSGSHHHHNNKQLSMKDAVKALYPPKAGRWIELQNSSGTGNGCTDRSRFTTLLLEHGEKHLQDWAVIAYTSPTNINSSSSSSSTGGIGGGMSPRKKPTETTWAAHGPTPTKSSSSSP